MTCWRTRSKFLIDIKWESHLTFHSMFTLDYTILFFLLFPLFVYPYLQFLLSPSSFFTSLLLSAITAFLTSKTTFSNSNQILILGDGAVLLKRQCGLSKRIQLLESDLGLDPDSQVMWSLVKCIIPESQFPNYKMEKRKVLICKEIHLTRPWLKSAR